MEQTHQNRAVLTHEKESCQYILHTEDYSGSYGLVGMKTNFRYNSSNKSEILETARVHSLERAKSLGVKLEEQLED